jgi:cellobiose transport system permease protein
MSSSIAMKRKNRSTLRKGEGRLAFLAVSPFYLIFLTFGLFPVLYSTYIAFFDWDPLGLHIFVGLDNFKTLLGDDRFWIALRNTLSIWVLSTVPQLAAALGIASILNKNRLKFSGFWRSAVLIPNITSTVAVAVVFSSIFGRDFGVVNYLLHFFGVDKIDWQSGTLSSHLEIAIMVIWRWTGYNALIYLAAMQSIPKELYESAELDGASGWKQFRYVTLPGIRNTMIFTVTVSTIGGLQIFGEPAIIGGASLSGGNDRQFSTLTLFLYEQAFQNFKFGYAAAIGILMLIVILFFALLNSWLTGKISRD